MPVLAVAEAFMKQPLPPPVTRYLVLAPTMALCMFLGSSGVSPLLRLPASLLLGLVLILLVARYQRSRSMG